MAFGIQHGFKGLGKIVFSCGEQAVAVNNGAVRILQGLGQGVAQAKGAGADLSRNNGGGVDKAFFRASDVALAVEFAIRLFFRVAVHGQNHTEFRMAVEDSFAIGKFNGF